MITKKIEAAKLNPSAVFKRPADVLKEKTFSRKDKIEILLQWAYDEREIAVAEEENMQGRPNADNGNRLSEIVDCLLKLNVTSQEKAPPTKQG